MLILIFAFLILQHFGDCFQINDALKLVENMKQESDCSHGFIFLIDMKNKSGDGGKKRL